MPTYDYLCSSCGRRVEIVHPIQGGPPEACPSCGAVATLRKSFAPPTILFKGTGWAKRDRAAAKAKASSKAASGGSKDGDAEGSSDKASTSGATSGTSGDRSKGSGGGEAGGTGAAATPATTAKADSSGD